MKNYCIGIVLLVLLSACQRVATDYEEINDTIVQLECKPSEALSLDSIAQYIKNIQITPLETNEQCLIGRIDKLCCFDNRYYLMDKRQCALFCFDESGKFVYKIHHYGRGPQEYVNLTDFVVGPQGIAILDIIQTKVMLYDLNGKYTSTRTLPSNAVLCGIISVDSSRTVLLTDGSFTEETGSGRFVTSYALDGTILSDQIPMPELYCKQMQDYDMTSTRVTHSGDTSWFNLPFDNRLICMRQDSVISIHQFFFNGEPSFLTQYQTFHANTDKDIFAFSDESTTPVIISPILEKKDYILIQPDIMEAMYLVIYNKKGGHKNLCYMFNKISAEMRVVNGLSPLYNGSGNKFYTVIYPLEINDWGKGTLGSSEIDEKYEQLRQMHLAVDDNPVIVSFDLTFEK